MCFFSIDLSDMHSDDDEKENISPDDLPAIVPIDTFGQSFEEAVSIFLYINYLILFYCVSFGSLAHRSLWMTQRPVGKEKLSSHWP